MTETKTINNFGFKPKTSNLGLTSEKFKELDSLLAQTNNLQLAKICARTQMMLNTRMGLNRKSK